MVQTHVLEVYINQVISNHVDRAEMTDLDREETTEILEERHLVGAERIVHTDNSRN